MKHYSLNVLAVSRSLADALINEETTINNFFIKLQSEKIFHDMSIVILTRARFIFSEKVLFIVKNMIQDMKYKRSGSSRVQKT